MLFTRVLGLSCFLILFLSPLSFAKEYPGWLASVPSQFSDQTHQIFDHPTWVRHPRSQRLAIQSEFFGFLLEDWELAYRLGVTLGVKGYQVQKLDQGWHVILSPRTSVVVIPLFHQKGRSLFLATGEHHGKLIRNLQLRALLLVEYDSVCSITAHIRIEQFLVDILAKITLPFVGNRIDKKLVSILQDVQKTAQVIHDHPSAAREAIENSPHFSETEKAFLLRYF